MALSGVFAAIAIAASLQRRPQCPIHSQILEISYERDRTTGNFQSGSAPR
ncbi:MAG: hypothetical protein HC771_25800 [Synechococcales cyanobacterium CRU_2_2]|nr:hypothetical protein [Synechococcales cyanobacterium CRU_2_2]